MENKQTRQEKEKQFRREAIISAAEKIFNEKGYENSSMEEIARVSEFTIRTLYQYFSNKEVLFFSVIDKIFQKVFSYLEDSLKSTKTGFDKVNSWIYANYQFYKDFPDLIRIMSYFYFMKPKEENIPEYQRLMQFNQDALNKLKNSIDAGKSDGTIRSDIDSEKTAYTIYFSTKSFFQEFYTTGKFLPHQEDFSLFAIDLLSKAFLGNK